MATEKRLIDVHDCPCDGCKAKPCGHPAKCVKFALWLNKTVDAVEVVRCGKCLYYSETTGKDSGKPCGYGVCTKPFHISYIVTNEDFCSFGQKRIGAKMDGDGNGQ